jgi:hypothetical protein
MKSDAYFRMSKMSKRSLITLMREKDYVDNWRHTIIQAEMHEKSVKLKKHFDNKNEGAE